MEEKVSYLDGITKILMYKMVIYVYIKLHKLSEAGERYYPSKTS